MPCPCEVELFRLVLRRTLQDLEVFRTCVCRIIVWDPRSVVRPAMRVPNTQLRIRTPLYRFEVASCLGLWKCCIFSYCAPGHRGLGPLDGCWGTYRTIGTPRSAPKGLVTHMSARFNFTDGWAPLSHFLGLPIPEENWGSSQDLGFRVQGSGFRVQGSGFRV